MKKHVALSLLTLALLTTGCATNTSSTTPLPSTTPESPTTPGSTPTTPGETTTTPSDPSTPITVEDHSDDIFALVNQAKEATNYTYGYLDESGQVLSEQLITPSFIIDSATLSGTYALTSYEDKTKTLLYSVEKNSDGFQVLNALSYRDSTTQAVSPYHETKELDYLALLDHEEVDWSNEVIYEQSGNYLVDDTGVVTVFASMFGLGEYLDYIMRIYFTYDAEEEMITIGFVSNYMDTDGTASTLIEGTKGYIKNVGKTASEEAKAFADSFTLSDTRLTKENLSYLTGDLVTYDSNLTIYLDDTFYSQPSLASFQYDLKGNRYRIVDSSSGVSEDESYYAKDEDGTLVEQFIGPDNTLQEVSQGVNYSVPDFLATIDYNAFVKTGENTYRYYGYQYDNLVKTMTGAVDGMGIVTQMTATTDSQGQLTSITARSRDVIVTESGMDRIFHYEMKLTFKEGEAIEEVQAYKDPADAKIEAALNRFQSTDGYSITTYRADNTKVTSTWTIRGDIALLDEYVPNTAPGSGNEYYHSYSGYAYDPETGLVTPFRVNDENVAKYYADGEEGYTSIDDFFGLTSLSAEVLAFKENSASIIVPKDKVHILDTALPIGPNGDFALERTLEITYDESKAALTGYTYKTDGLGTDKAEIKLGTSLPETIDFSAIQTPFVAPTTWKEGCPEIYEAMKAKKWIGDSVDEIPYLYDPVLNDTWFAGNPDGYIEFPINNTYASSTGSEYNVAYVDKYIDLLFEKGYKIGQSEPGYERYGKEGLPFVIMIDSKGATGMIQISIRDASVMPYIPVTDSAEE